MTNASSSAAEKLSALSGEKRRLLERMVEQRVKSAEEITPYPRATGDGKARLATSWAQQRLWFINQLEGAGAAYHIPVAVRLRGNLNLPAMRAALDALVRRHEIMRTVLVNVDGDPQQEIAPAGEFSLKVIDLCEYGEAQCEAQVVLQATEEARARFDLCTGPLARGRLLKLRQDEHVLLITMHHIISDGWSMGVFTRELALLYGACVEGRDDPLPPLPIQYGDYAQWQRLWLRGDVLESQLTYWRKLLQDSPVQLELPADRVRPEVQSYQAQNTSITLSDELSRQVHLFAQRHQMTLFMVLYAAWAILFSRLSGQQDVVIGTPVANRRRSEFDGLIGFFVNTLALRIDVDGELDLGSFLGRVKQLTLAAYSHQDVPFEKVVEALHPQRSLSRSPLFQVMFVLQNTPQSEMSLPGLIVTPETGIEGPSMFDLLISMEDRGKQIKGTVTYATDLFDRSTIDRWMGYFGSLLSVMTCDINDQLDSLLFLPDAERQRLLETFNSRDIAYSRAKTIHELFEDQARCSPGALAVVFEQQLVTYSELNRRANRLAWHLRSRGVGPDQVVGVCATRSPNLVIAVLAIIKAGGAYLPLDPNYPPERLQYMLEDAAPRVVLTQRDLLSVLPDSDASLVLVDELGTSADGTADENVDPEELGLTPDHLIYVIYTSGSTGRPKGTTMPHRSVVNLIEWHREVFGDGTGIRVLQFAALSFDVAFQEIFSTLCTGGTLVLLEEHIRRDTRALMDLLRWQRVNRLFVPPLVLQSLAEHSATLGDVPESLKDVITAGEQLRITREISTFFGRAKGCRLHNHYGPTETHVVTSLTLLGDSSQWPTLPSIGSPVSNIQIYILDAHLMPVPTAVVGEIYIGGTGVARGYLRRPELTGTRFIDDPFSRESGARLYRTGDLGRWRINGTVEYLGRNDDQVKIRGYRIELGEIQSQLMQHPAVKEAAVIVREDIPGDKSLVAYFTARDEGVPTAEELRAHLKIALPEYMVPGAIVAMSTFPLTPNGKLNHRALPKPGISAFVSRKYESPRGEIEVALTQIWQELLQVDRIGREDNFFELGGHSLQGMKLIAKAADRLSVELSVVVVFKHPTIRLMANYVETLWPVVQEPVGGGEELVRGVL